MATPPSSVVVTLHDAEAGGSGHRFGINSLASSPDGELFTAGRDGTVRCWSLGASPSAAELRMQMARPRMREAYTILSSSKWRLQISSLKMPSSSSFTPTDSNPSLLRGEVEGTC